MREKSERTTVVVEPGTLGNETEEAITVSFATKTRFNVAGQLPDFMSAVKVYETIHGLSTAELVNSAVALKIGYDGPLTADKKVRAPKDSKVKGALAAIGVAKVSEAKNKLFELFTYMNEGHTDAEVAAMRKQLGFDKSPF